MDLYVGGAEHAVLHLLRVLHKVLSIGGDEARAAFVSQGMILGEMEYTFVDAEGGYVSKEKTDGSTPSSWTPDVVKKGACSAPADE